MTKMTTPSPGLADALAVQTGTLRAMASAGQTMSILWPAACLVAASPFFWAPPLWVLALMAAPSSGNGSGPAKPPMGPPAG